LRKVLPVIAGDDVFAQRHALKARIIERRDSFRIEAIDARQELPEARSQQVATLPEEMTERGAIVFDAAFEMRHAEGHRRRLRLNIQLLEETCEQRVGHMIEDHETGINRQLAPRFRDIHCVRVSAA
jgi:hypothetical protein